MSRLNDQAELEDEMYDDFDEDTQKDKYLTFQIGTEDYGIEIKYVIEIITMQAVTSVPEMPDFVKGIINLRGRVIPVMDVRIRFNLEPKPYDDRTCIVVVEVKNVSVGLIVDRVNEVIDIQPAQIEGPPKTGSIVNKGYIQGMGKLDKSLKILLNIEKILYDKAIDKISSQF